MADRPRLIEVAFPLKEASLDSVHEKNVRHGHISTLHIWPARRPLAASRAALIATLLPDPGDAEKRRELLRKLGGKLVTSSKTGKEETEGGVLHWGRESSPDMDWFREEIRKAYGGRSPRVLDPFSGGGAIPLEAMRLGCEVTAVDINPVAWFILKCTLEYPQKLAGKKLPLPKFAMELPAFRKAWEDAQVKAGKKKGKQKAGTIDMFEQAPEVDLAWHVRAWGHWVLEAARQDLEKYYPVVDEKPAVAYLWARTVKCKGCGAAIPLLKTRWLCKKKEGKRVALAMKPNANRSGVVFEIFYPTATQAKDKKFAVGTMSRSGAQCPCCPAIMTMEDIRLESQAGRLGAIMTGVIVDGQQGKEYRSPTAADLQAAANASSKAELAFKNLPYGTPKEPINTGSIRKGGVSVTRWGIATWDQLFLPRQLHSLGIISTYTAQVERQLKSLNYPAIWQEAVCALLAAVFGRLVDYLSGLCFWNKQLECLAHTFTRYALPMVWDISEANPFSGSTGDYLGGLDWVARAVESISFPGSARILHQSAIQPIDSLKYDVVMTDPPYYDAIPYADLADFFYVWLRRILPDVVRQRAFDTAVIPKWNAEERDGELIDDESRFGGDRRASRLAYEDGMYRAFSSAFRALAPDGRMVTVFANKQPEAWGTLVSALIRAGLVVDSSWPIMTEQSGGVRNAGRASLASSVWLVCKKRPEAARPGWDNRVLEDMRERINTRLRDFWDAGIRGPDFVWAATGPALEAYSKHPVVKKANETGQVMSVSEFLRHVRRFVVDFVVGRVLTGNGNAEAMSSLDDVTTYYLLHRNDFGLNEAPAGASILYAVSCGLSDRDLSDRFDLLTRTGSRSAPVEQEEDPEEIEGEDEEEEGEAPETGGGKGNKVKLKAWDQRKSKNLGMDVEGRPAPLVDQVHRLMHFWRAGDQTKVNAYLDARVLWKNALFHQILQAFIELSPEGSEERNILEAISNHVGVKGKAVGRQMPLPV
ncbi:DUF1156 domain-containing protein [Sorangium sp. So ce321]|uniref:DUF1156 domain-containing protein n=1 Tax=Sorangium sp. So ce321 TaxID=3133300 RepID=UPI003F638384